MTAVNIVGSAKHNTIVMVTDAASYDDAGFVRRIASKVRPIPEWSAAITGRGNTFGIETAAHELLQRAGSFVELVSIVSRELPLIVEQRALTRPFELFMAGFFGGYPNTFYIRTEGGNDSLGGWPPHFVCPVGTIAIGPSSPDTRAVGPDTADAPDVIVEKLGRVIRAQRRILADDGYPRVGGFAELTIITPGNVEQRVLHTWCEDRIGQRMSAEDS
ncbi:hypothetical protein ACQR1I_35395 [Bradyrhizobium sp. HKCCYLS2038]|uniref:hypothetical protein n=1 Tax=unclassified Bradyrhizobium TaxID=2631580 RepID=UPI003EB9AEB8